MRHGHKREAQLKALCDYTKWALEAFRQNPQDAELGAFARAVQLLTMNELFNERSTNETADLESIGYTILGMSRERWNRLNAVAA